MKSDAKFNEAVSYVIKQLQSLQLSDPRWVSVVGQQTELSVTGDNVKPAREQFPESDQVTKQFTVESLRRSVEDLLAGQSSQTKLSVGELAAVSRQVQFLLDLQRYLSRRKVGRCRRIINAAHRRAILTHPLGPLNQQLRASVDELLAQSR